MELVTTQEDQITIISRKRELLKSYIKNLEQIRPSCYDTRIVILSSLPSDGPHSIYPGYMFKAEISQADNHRLYPLSPPPSLITGSPKFSSIIYHSQLAAALLHAGGLRPSHPCFSWQTFQQIRRIAKTYSCMAFSLSSSTSQTNGGGPWKAGSTVRP